MCQPAVWTSHQLVVPQVEVFDLCRLQQLHGRLVPFPKRLWATDGRSMRMACMAVLARVAGLDLYGQHNVGFGKEQHDIKAFAFNQITR